MQEVAMNLKFVPDPSRGSGNVLNFMIEDTLDKDSSPESLRVIRSNRRDKIYIRCNRMFSKENLYLHSYTVLGHRFFNMV